MKLEIILGIWHYNLQIKNKQIHLIRNGININKEIKTAIYFETYTYEYYINEL